MNHKNFDELLANLRIRQDTYIYGPTGSGKSRAVSEAAKALKLPFYKKLIGSQMTEASLLGYMSATGTYVEGITFKPFTEGGILLMDELDNGNPNTNLVLNGLCDGEMAFPVGMKNRHEDCIIVGTANTLGHGATLEYCGRNRIDSALTNRLVFIGWPYDEELEESIAKDEYIKLGGSDGEKLKSLLADVRRFRQVIKELKVTNIIISPRTTLQAVRKLAIGRPAVEILRVFLKGVDIELGKKIINQVKDTKVVRNTLDENRNWLKETLPEEVVKSYLLEQDLALNPFIPKP